MWNVYAGARAVRRDLSEMPTLAVVPASALGEMTMPGDKRKSRNHTFAGVRARCSGCHRTTRVHQGALGTVHRACAVRRAEGTLKCKVNAVWTKVE